MSTEGHHPNMADKEFQKLLTIGPISRSARDLKLALQIMAGDNAIDLNLETKVDTLKILVCYFT